jgi:hypothetical protein
MASTNDIREFLISWRANVTPARAGISDLGGERRVPGFRREEVATLGGESPDYTPGWCMATSAKPPGAF